MKEVNIQHFLGDTVLNQSIDGVNEFLIAQERNSYPYFILLVNGLYANVSFIPSEESAGFQAFSDDTEMDLDPEESTIFYTNTPTEEIEIYNDYVIPKSLAMQIAIEFVKTGDLPDCVEWDEL